MNKDEQWLLEEKYGGDTNVAGFKEDCARLASGEPVAYVIGWQPFLGLKIYLDSHPLIPRPETEHWTEQLLSEVVNDDSEIGTEISAHRQSTKWERSGPLGQVLRPFSTPPARVSRLRFLDLCAGSSAIGCAVLKMLPDAEVYFGELDAKHEATILKNIRENNLDASRAHVKIGDLFAPFGNMTFDVIATNPPYIPESRELPESVARYEPALALRASADGLGIIRRIAESLPNHLHTGGVAWIECDSAHAETACALFSTQGLTAEIRTDQFGKSRVIVVSLR